MSTEEEKLDAIRREVWWLSTFLVKIPLIISGLVAVVWIGSQIKCSKTVYIDDDYDVPMGDKIDKEDDPPTPPEDDPEAGGAEGEDDLRKGKPSEVNPFGTKIPGEE